MSRGAARSHSAAGTAAGLVLATLGGLTVAPAADSSTPGGPQAAYRCSFNVNTDAFTGADGTASAIGWLGDHNSVITCLGGTFVVQDGPGGLFQNDGFGVYDGQRATWADADGYLPAQVTTFEDRGATVAITEFADEIVLGDHPYVAVYSRVRVANPSGHAVDVNPQASPALLALGGAPDTVPAHGSVNHDYVVLADRFGADVAWPSAQALAAAGGFDAHFAHMRRFWNAQLASIAQVTVPDTALVNAYKSGFISTQIARSGNDLDTGVNGYESEFSHDVIGILTNLFTQGSFTDAHALLTEARNVDGIPGPVRRRPVDLRRALGRVPAEDGRHLVRGAELRHRRPGRRGVGAEHRGRGTHHRGRPHRAHGDHGGDQRHRHPGVLDPRRLRGAPRPGRLPLRGDHDRQQCRGQLGRLAVRQPARRHQRRARPDDQPEPPGLPALLAGAAEHGEPLRQPARRQLDVAVRHLGLGGFAARRHVAGARPDDDRRHLRLRLRPPARPAPARHDRGLPGRLLLERATTPRRASAGLAASTHRDQGILDYEFMVANGQSGPNSWWESSSAPDPDSPWVGAPPRRRGRGRRRTRGAWPGANKVLLDSLVAQQGGGALVVGRGVPSAWLRAGTPSISVTNFPSTDGRRLGVTITASSTTRVSLRLQGARPAGPVLFELPAFLHDVASTSAGTVDQATGTVTLSAGVRVRHSDVAPPGSPRQGAESRRRTG